MKSSVLKNRNKTFSNLINLIDNHPITTLICMMLVSFVVAYFPFVFKGSVFIYADIGSDTENVYYPFFHLLFNKIKSGDPSLWTFDYGLGTNLLSRQTDTCSIFTYMYFIFGKANIKYSLIWVHFLKMLICGLFAFKFFSLFEYSNPAKIIASYLYAFNGFLTLWGQHYFFSTASICIIALILSVEYTIKAKKANCYIILSSTFVLLVSYYFAYMCLIVAAIYLFFRIIYIFFTQKRIYIKTLLWIAFSVIFSFLLSSILFIPSITFAIRESSRLSSDQSIFSIIKNNLFSLSSPKMILTGVLRLFSNNLLGVSEYCGETNYYEAPQYFLSSLNVFVATMLFLESLFRFKKERVKSILIVVVELLVLYSICFKFIPIMFNGFVYEVYRYTFVLIPFFALGYAEVFNKIFKNKLFNAKIEIFLSTIVSLIVLFFSYYLNGSRTNVALATLFVCILSLVTISISTLCYKSFISSNIASFVFIAITIFAFMFNVCFDTGIVSQKRTIASDFNPQNYTGHESDSVIKAIEKIKKNDKTFCRTEKSFYTICNEYADSMIEGYKGISAYDSLENKYVQEFVNTVCPEMIFGPVTHYHCFYNIKSNVQVNTVLGVKYIISKSEHEYDDLPEFVLFDKVDDLFIYKNNLADSIARVYYNTSDNYNNDTNLINTLIINDENATRFSNNKSSESVKTIYIDSHNSSHIYGKANMKKGGYLFLAVPYSNGWSATIDGKKAEIVRADYGFSAIKINKGSHDVELNYSTPNLRICAIISACSLLLLIAFILVKRIKHTELILDK